MADSSGRARLPLSKKPSPKLILPPVAPPAAAVPCATAAAIGKQQALVQRENSRLVQMQLAKAQADDADRRAALASMKDAIDSLVPFVGKKGLNAEAEKICKTMGYKRTTLIRNATKVAAMRASDASRAQKYPESEYLRAYGISGIGRRPRISPEVHEEMQARIDVCASTGDAVKKVGGTRSKFLNAKFDGVVGGSHRDVLQGLIHQANHFRFPLGNMPAHLSAPLAASTLSLSVSAFTKPTPVGSDWSTARRRAARDDIGNSISLAAALAFVNRWAPGLGVKEDTIQAEYVSNYDQSSVNITGDSKIEVYIGENSSKDLRSKSASVKTSKVGEKKDGGFGNKNRCYGYATLTKQSGELLMYLQIVKDTCYKGKGVVASSVSTSSLVVACSVWMTRLTCRLPPSSSPFPSSTTRTDTFTCCSARSSLPRSRSQRLS
jgi:hypothetical protein